MTSASSIGGAMRRIVIADDSAIGSNMYLDSAPEDVIPPYITYNDDVSVSVKLSGDRKASHYTTHIQLDIWQKMTAEDMLLPARIRELFNGVSLDVYGALMKPTVTVFSSNRLQEPIGSNLVHHAITLEVVHEVTVV